MSFNKSAKKSNKGLSRRLAMVLAIMLVLSVFTVPAFGSDKDVSVNGLKQFPNMERTQIEKNPESSDSGFITPSVDDDAINDGKYPGLGDPVPASGAIPRIKASAIPAGLTSFDWKSKVPAVRDQGNYGDCWAFASLLSATASLASAGITATPPPELSPYHLCYAAYNSRTYYALPTMNSAGDAMQTGGNDYYAIAAMSKWFGPKLETAFPYPPLSAARYSGITSITSLNQRDYKLTNTNIFPSPRTSSGTYSAANTEAIKSGVYNYGPLSVSYYAGDSIAEYSESHVNAAKEPYYYNNYYSYADHAVTIVGWDDTIARTNFSPQPPGNGAWLIQNSWGLDFTGEGDDGYFWLSYYDTSIGTAASYKLDTVKSSTYMNYMDDLGFMGGSFKVSNSMTEYMANVFLMQPGEEVYGVDAVSVFTAYPGTTYTISVYANPKSGNPTSGIQQSIGAGTAMNVTSTQTYAGYHTIKFGSPAFVGAGETFSVVVKVTKTDPSDMSLTFEEKVSSGDYLTIAKGQSFYGTDGSTWSDLYDLTTNHTGYSDVGNFNIRAFSGGATIQSIKMNPKSPPVTSMQKGNSLNRSKGGIIVTYSDGSTETIPLSSNLITVSGYNKALTGTQTVRLSFRGSSCTYKVTVSNIVIKTSKSSYSLKSKKSTTPKITVTKNGKKITAKAAGLTYKTSNKNVATVSSSGKITAKKVKKASSCKITITANNGATKVVTVKVKP